MNNNGLRHAREPLGARDCEGKTIRSTAAGLILVAMLASPALALDHPFVGEWTATATTPGGDVHETISVVETDDGYAITARLVGVAEDMPQAGPGTDIVLDGDSFSYKRTLTTPDGGLEITYTGIVSGDTFTGTVDMGFAQAPYNGVRVVNAE